MDMALYLMADEEKERSWFSYPYAYNTFREGANKRHIVWQCINYACTHGKRVWPGLRICGTGLHEALATRLRGSHDTDHNTYNNG